MDDIRVGRLLRALRKRRRWRQADVAAAAGVAQTTISLIERGHLDRLALRTVRTVFATVDARFDGYVSWRGGAIDRLLDERHAHLVAAVALLLRSHGWRVEVEVTFAIYADRGSIDILAFDPRTRTLLVVEVKTEITSIEETARRHDLQVRRGAQIAAQRFGWQAASVSKLLVVLDESTSRRRVARHAGTLEIAYPTRGRDVRRWLSRPQEAMRGLMFLSPSNHRGGRSPG